MGKDIKNVLIISQYFAPQNIIAAIRFTKVVKYLSKTGKYRFFVICADHGSKYQKDELLQKDIDNIGSYVTVITVDMKKRLVEMAKNSLSAGEIKDGETAGKRDIYFQLQENFLNNRQSGIIGASKRFIGKLVFAFNDIYDLMCEDIFAYRAEKTLHQIPLKKIDVMISTYGAAGAIRLALKIHQRYPQIKWIADYRDPVLSESGIKKMLLYRLALKADQKAAYITGATKSCIGSGKYRSKFRWIPNGYDREDLDGITPTKNNKMTICYTGSLYYGKRDMSILLKMISELIQEQKMDKEKINIVYAGEKFYLLQLQAAKYGLSEILCNKGMVIRKEALTIQKQADILCALTWNNEGNDNILTGKVLEYFMMNKPIFAVVTGNKPESIIKQIINKANLGYCIEEAGLEQNYDVAKSWLLNRYNEYIDTGSIECHPIERILEKYSSQKMAERFGCLIDVCGCN